MSDQIEKSKKQPTENVPAPTREELRSSVEKVAGPKVQARTALASLRGEVTDEEVTKKCKYPEQWESFEALIEAYHEEVIADKSKFGGLSLWRAYNQELYQCFHEAWHTINPKGSASLVYPFVKQEWFSVVQAPWKNKRFHDAWKPAAQRIADVLARYRQEKNVWVATPPYKAHIPAAAEISFEQLHPTIAPNPLPGDMQERYVQVDAAFAEVYKRYENPESALDRSMQKLILRYWNDARARFAKHIQEKKPAASNSFFGNASSLFAKAKGVADQTTRLSAFKPDMDPIAVRAAVLEDAAKFRKQKPLSADALEAILQFKLHADGIIGDDGRFGTSEEDFKAEGSLEAVVEFGPVLEQSQKKEAGDVKIVESLTGMELELEPFDGINHRSIDWMLDAHSSPEPLTGIPDGVTIGVKEGVHPMDARAREYLTNQVAWNNFFDEAGTQFTRYNLLSSIVRESNDSDLHSLQREAWKHVDAYTQVYNATLLPYFPKIAKGVEPTQEEVAAMRSAMSSIASLQKTLNAESSLTSTEEGVFRKGDRTFFLTASNDSSKESWIWLDHEDDMATEWVRVSDPEAFAQYGTAVQKSGYTELALNDDFKGSVWFGFPGKMSKEFKL